ncbi:hypothetical protein HNP33_002633, partial [Comamonas odontotermitis]|nr:hypothetical protein [Comamonas odontotermitis]
QFVVRYLRRPQFVSLIIRAYYRCGPDLCNKALSNASRPLSAGLTGLSRKFTSLISQYPTNWDKTLNLFSE